MSDSSALVNKLWAFCSVLRDDGVGTLDYTEQLTYLLFWKMAHEREPEQSTQKRLFPRIVPGSFFWIQKVSGLRKLIREFLRLYPSRVELWELFSARHRTRFKTLQS